MYTCIYTREPHKVQLIGENFLQRILLLCKCVITSLSFGRPPMAEGGVEQQQNDR